MEQNKHISELESQFTKAVGLHQHGDINSACEIYYQILAQIPDSPLVHYNLGLALFEQKEFEKSCDHYRTALKQAPQNTDVLYNLALSLGKLGKLEEAIAIYEEIIENAPDDIDSLYNIGCAHKDSYDFKSALHYYERVLAIDPNHQQTLNNMAFIHHNNGDLAEAKALYSRLLDIVPGHAAANHMLSSLKGDTLQTADPRYVAEVFDAYSHRYESSLVENLEYSVPQKLRRFFDDLYSVPPNNMKALDIGCGTGLGGIAFKDICKSLDGVDISPNMIEFARQKHIYSALYVDEIENYLGGCEVQYDLVLAADVFTYIGGLENIFKLIYGVLEKSRFFCFSTEKSAEKNYFLQSSGRFAHSELYIAKLAEKFGFHDFKSLPTKLRKEKNKWVEGIIFVLRK